MGRYCEEVKKVGNELMKAIIESLKLNRSTQTKKD